MLPILFTIGPIKIYTFGVFLMLAFFWGMYLLWYLIRLTTYKEEEVFDCLFLSLAGALFFGRLIYVILNFNQFGFSFLKFILINGYPGLSLIGVLFGGGLVCYLFSFVKKIKFNVLIDYFISPVFLALAIGKLGSFFAGIEIGTKTKIPLSIRYFGFDGIRHLTPFYESILFFIGCYLSYRIIFEIRKDNFFKGFNGLFFLWFFSLSGLLLEKIKEKHLFLGRNNFNQTIFLIFFLTISIYFLYYFKTIIIQFLKITFYGIKDICQKTARKIRKRKAQDS